MRRISEREEKRILDGGGGWGRKSLGYPKILMGCKKCMGLKPGEKIERLGEIRVVCVTREPPKLVYDADVVREGFPVMNSEQFIEMFCREMHCTPETGVTRIEFEYV